MKTKFIKTVLLVFLSHLMTQLTVAALLILAIYFATTNKTVVWCDNETITYKYYGQLKQVPNTDNLALFVGDKLK